MVLSVGVTQLTAIVVALPCPGRCFRTALTTAALSALPETSASS